MSAVHIGTSVDFTANVLATDGTLTDPDTMEVRLRHQQSGAQENFPDGDPSITNPSVGVWVFSSPPLDQVGTWWVAFIGEGDGVTVTDEASQEVCGLHVALT